MSASRIAYTAFVAFLSVVATLLVVSLVSEDDAYVPPEKKGPNEGRAVFTLDEVREHDHAESCWKVIDGVVYDVTDYIPRHPSDEDAFLRWCGREATQAWSGHSARAESMLRDYRIGALAGHEPKEEPPAETEPAISTETLTGAAEALTRRQGSVLLSLGSGEYLDGVYRGNFIDRGHIQVSIQFRLEDGKLHDLGYRHLYYRDVDYLKLDDDEPLQAVMRQHEQILSQLEGQPLTDIFRLYRPAEVVDDIDGYSGATLRGAKILHAIRDGLNRGVYSW